MSAHPDSHEGSLLPIFLLATAGFTVLTTEFVIVALLPPMAKDLRVSVSQAGLLVTLFALTVGVVGPLLTARLAHYERKTLFVFTLLLFAFSNALAALAPNIAVMTVARFFPALMLPVFWGLASETGARIMGPQHTGKAISLVNFGIVAATIFGIPIGTLISDRFGWRTAFAVIAVLALMKALLLFVFLPVIKGNHERISVWRQMSILREFRVSGHVLLSLLVYAGIFTAYTFLVDILEKIGGFSGAAVGWILMGFGDVNLGYSATKSQQSVIKALHEGAPLQMKVNRFGDGWVIQSEQGQEIGALSRRANETLSHKGIHPRQFQFQPGEVTVRSIFHHLKTDEVTGDILEDWFVVLPLIRVCR